MSTSDLPPPTPPPRDGVVPTVEVVNYKPRSLSHEEAEVQVEGDDLLLVIVCMHPSCIGELKKLQVFIINKYVRKFLARKNGIEILIWSWNNPYAII